MTTLIKINVFNKNATRFYSSSTLSNDIVDRLNDIYNSDVAVTNIKTPAKSKSHKYVFVNLINQPSLPRDAFISLFNHLVTDISTLNTHNDNIYNIYLVLPIRPVIYKSKEMEIALAQFTDYHNDYVKSAEKLLSFPGGSKLKSHLNFIDGLLGKWRTTINFTDDNSKLQQGVITKIEKTWNELYVPKIHNGITVNKIIQFKKLQFIDPQMLNNTQSSFIGISQAELFDLVTQASIAYKKKRAEKQLSVNHKHDKIITPKKSKLIKALETNSINSIP